MICIPPRRPNLRSLCLAVIRSRPHSPAWNEAALALIKSGRMTLTKVRQFLDWVEAQPIGRAAAAITRAEKGEADECG